MSGTAEIFIDHILESIALIEEYTRGKTLDDFEDTVALRDMVFRRLEIIGEAVKNLPEPIKKQHPEIPWKQIAGMRDKLIHHYFGVDIGLTWNVVEKELPKLKECALAIQRELK